MSSQDPTFPHDSANPPSRDPDRDDPNASGAAQPQQSRAGEDASAAARVRERVASRRSSLDDYDAEEQLWTGGYSPKAMIGTWVLMTLVSIGILVASILTAEFSIWIALAIILVLWIIGGLVYAWRRLGVQYELTSQRFIHKAGLLTRRADRIEVIDIDDVSYSQGPIQRLLGVGTIVINSSDRSHPELTMSGIQNVADVAGLIDDIRRTERRKRSLHIEQV